MRDIRFRTLRADEIEVRPAMTKEGKTTLLLYIDSRAVVRILNETVGALGWQMEFYEINGNTVGKLGIWDDERGMWIWKSDTGSESNVEAKKGLFSDCYKRCLSRWGVDELYTAPRIVVDDDGYGCKGLRVQYIEYNDNREIVRLVIVNRWNKPVFDWCADNNLQNPIEQPQKMEAPQQLSPALNDLTYFCSTKKTEDGVNKGELVKFFNFYKKLIEANGGWKGKFMASRLWDSWLKTA